MIYTYTDEQVDQAINWRDVLQDLPFAFQSLRTGNAAIQARQRTDCGSYKLSGMGAVWESRKTYTSVHGQFNFFT